MIKLTKLTDYGVLLLTCMAGQPETLFTAAQLAGYTHIPLPTVSKILQLLLKSELLCSSRGASGGYRLSRQPMEISLGEIICALEGPVALTDCSSAEGSCCDQGNSCSLMRNWNRINEAIADVFGRISLQNLLDPNFEPRPYFSLRGLVSLTPIPSEPK